jgi:hypothetical protein
MNDLRRRCYGNTGSGRASGRSDWKVAQNQKKDFAASVESRLIHKYNPPHNEHHRAGPPDPYYCGIGRPIQSLTIRQWLQDSGKCAKSVIEGLEAVLRMIEGFHKRPVASYTLSCRDTKGREIRIEWNGRQVRIIR